MVIIETPNFTRLVQKILADDDYRMLQEVLSLNPHRGALIPGGGGLRKIRWRIPGRGKRGGVRIIYYLLNREKMLFLYIYPKSKQGDLTKDQLKLLRKILKEEYYE